MRENCAVLGLVGKKSEAREFFCRRKMGTVDAMFSQELVGRLGGLGEKLGLGLKELQHRGQESTGFAVSQNVAIGHNRYSTTGENSDLNIQPVFGEFKGKLIALAHNGNLINTSQLKELAEKRGFDFSKIKIASKAKAEEELSDTWVILALLETSPLSDFIEAIKEVLPMLQGAFSLVILYEDMVIAARDRFGIRPLCLGENDDYFIIASESCALGSLGADFVRDLGPGELWIATRDGTVSSIWAENQELKICIFEYIYFGRPDSIMEGISIYLARKNLGRSAALEHLSSISGADLIVPVKDSGTLGAIGVHEETGISFDSEVLCRPHFTYVRPRTFIESDQGLREEAVWLKFRPILFDIQEKTIILVDDSIVRATTIPRVIKLLKNSQQALGKTVKGAKKIFVLITSPPYMFPCYYGIDTWRYFESGELCARNFSGDIEKIRKHIGADYLGYLSLESTIKAILKADLTGKMKPCNFCTACFTGEYPAPIENSH